MLCDWHKGKKIRERGDERTREDCRPDQQVKKHPCDDVKREKDKKEKKARERETRE